MRTVVAVHADVWRLVQDVVLRIQGPVHRADGDGQLRVRVGHAGNVDGLSGKCRRGVVSPSDARTREKEGKNVVVLRIFPSLVLAGTKHVVERYVVAGRVKIKLQHAQVIHARNRERLPDQRRHAVGNVEQVRVSGRATLTPPTTKPCAKCVSGIARTQNQTTFDGEIHRLPPCHVTNLVERACELNVRCRDPFPKQHVVDVLRRGQTLVNVHLGESAAPDKSVADNNRPVRMRKKVMQERKFFAFPQDKATRRGIRLAQAKSTRADDSFLRAWKMRDFTVPMGISISSAISS